MSNCDCQACQERRNEVDHASLRALEARALAAEERELALMKEFETARAELTAMNEVYQRGCECSADEACVFARERDAARARVVELENDPHIRHSLRLAHAAGRAAGLEEAAAEAEREFAHGPPRMTKDSIPAAIRALVKR